jgi:two-component system NarL family response regulator
VRNISVLIADDHIVVRLGLRTLIQSQHDMRLAGEASNARDAVAEFDRTRPGVSLLDLRMPERGGIEALRGIKALDENARVLMLSSFGSEEEIYQALHAGALGYVLKDSSSEDLLKAMREVNQGRSWISAGVAARYAIRNQRPELTGREMEVLRLIFEGLTNKEIAYKLGVAENTVKNHINNLMVKLNARDRTQAAHVALERGLLLLN